jgi:hypothetical protein
MFKPQIRATFAASTLGARNPCAPEETLRPFGVGVALVA